MASMGRPCFCPKCAPIGRWERLKGVLFGRIIFRKERREALSLYWAAQTPEQEGYAYRRMISLGLKKGYGE